MPAKEPFKVTVEDDENEATSVATSDKTEEKPLKKKKTVKPAVKKTTASKAVPKNETDKKESVKERKVPAKKKVKVIDEDAGEGPIEKMLKAKPAEVVAEAPVKPLPEMSRPEPGVKKPAPKMDDILAQRQSAVKAVIAGAQSGSAAVPKAEAKTEVKGYLKPLKPVSVPEQEEEKPIRRSIKLYRNIAVSFIAFTVVVLAVIFYFAFAKVTITLVPNQERLTNNMIFDVIDTENNDTASANSVKGLVKNLKITAEEKYETSGKEVIGKEAVGKVVIYNNYTKNQPLVATTRLIAADGQLFRLKDTVNIPAGGQVDAEVYADQPTPESALATTKFSIPGLWAGLQDKIYAENKEPIVYREKVKKRIVQEDLDNATRDIKQKLLAKAKEEVRANYREAGETIFKIDDNSLASKIVGEVGDEVDSFTAAMEADVVVVAFDKAAAVELEKEKLLVSLGDTRELISFNADQTIYALNTYDAEAGEASINATFEGQVSLRENAKVVDVDKIMGLSDEQLNTYLSSLPEIAGFEVVYFPSFIKRVPRLVDRIQIVIRK